MRLSDLFCNGVDLRTRSPAAPVAPPAAPWQSSCLHAYSHRLSWDFHSNFITRLVEEKRARGLPVLDLTISNPTEAFAQYPHDAIQLAYANLSDFTYRPAPFGELSARRAVIDWYEDRGIMILPEQVLLTASSSEAYALLFKLFCDPLDEILAPVPSYPLFEFLAKLESVRIVPYRLLYDGAWFIDFASLREQISARTRAIVVVNPNNPTGSFLKNSEKNELLDLARASRLPIISDEVFTDYSFGASTDRIATLVGCDSVLSFSLNGLSKVAGMPQMKLGWMVVNGPKADRDIARARLEVLLDTYLSVSTPVQRALPSLLETGAAIQREIAAQTKQNLDILNRVLQRSAAHPLHTEGGWSAIIQLPNTSTEHEWVACLIEQQSVLVHPGYLFEMGSEPYIIVSLITAPEIFEEAICRLQVAVAS